MSDLWVPVIAALGSSLLTGLAAFGIEWWRSYKSGKAALIERRNKAYSLLITRVGLVAYLAFQLHALMEVRSGLRDRINTTLRIQKPLDTLDLLDRMASEMKPLYEAWTEVWMVGSEKAIAIANDLVLRCGNVISVATQGGKARPDFMRSILGEKWTKAQLDEWNKELRAIAEARRLLSVIARQEAGIEVVDLFASDEQSSLNAGTSEGAKAK